MRDLLKWVAAISVLVWACPNGASSAAFLVGVPDVAGFSPGADPSSPLSMIANSPLAISDDGSTVVGQSNVPPLEPYFLGFRWTAASGIETLGGPALGTAQDVSGDGSVIVGLNGSQGYRWTETTGFTSLGSLPGAFASGTPYAISGDASTVVGSAYDRREKSEAFRVVGSGPLTGLGRLPGFTDASFALGVSGDGSRVVGASRSTSLDLQAFLWTEGAGMVGLGDLVNPLAPYSMALDISLDGSVVVGFSASQAFEWSAEAGMRELHGGSSASAVSSDGSVVGGAGACGDSLSCALIWNANRDALDLAGLLGAVGVDVVGWQLLGVRGMSADGLTFTGAGTDPLGVHRGWIAHLDSIPNHPIPEPSSLLLLTAGIAISALLCRAR